MLNLVGRDPISGDNTKLSVLSTLDSDFRPSAHATDILVGSCFLFFCFKIPIYSLISMLYSKTLDPDFSL